MFARCCRAPGKQVTDGCGGLKKSGRSQTDHSLVLALSQSRTTLVEQIDQLALTNMLVHHLEALKRQPHITRRIAASMFGSYQRAPLNRATRIVPVPLHPEREKVRGFNQAAVLARELSRRARLPFCDKSLIRTAHTALHRGGMDAQARRESVENVFAVRRPEAISGERILLVDDVFTTGATVSACASVLLAAGAKEVLVLTVARPADA